MQRSFDRRSSVGILNNAQYSKPYHTVHLCFACLGELKKKGELKLGCFFFLFSLLISWKLGLLLLMLPSMSHLGNGNKTRRTKKQWCTDHRPLLHGIFEIDILRSYGQSVWIRSISKRAKEHGSKGKKGMQPKTIHFSAVCSGFNYGCFVHSKRYPCVVLCCALVHSMLVVRRA